MGVTGRDGRRAAGQLGTASRAAVVAIGGVLAGIDWRLRFAVHSALIATASLDLTYLFTTSLTDYSGARFLHLVMVAVSYLVVLFIGLWFD